MKYLSRLFAPSQDHQATSESPRDPKQQQQQQEPSISATSAARLTSHRYSVIFVQNRAIGSSHLGSEPGATTTTPTPPTTTTTEAAAATVLTRADSGAAIRSRQPLFESSSSTSSSSSSCDSWSEITVANSGEPYCRRLDDLFETPEEEEVRPLASKALENESGPPVDSRAAAQVGSRPLVLSSLGDYFLTASLGKTSATTSSVASRSAEATAVHVNIQQTEQQQQQRESLVDGDWILIDQSEAQQSGRQKRTRQQQQVVYRKPRQQQQQQLQGNKHSSSSCKLPSQPTVASCEPTTQHTTATASSNSRRLSSSRPQARARPVMALDQADIELIKVSWLLARQDTVASGILLFKGLFTKFPQYMRLFSQFSDLDLDNMRDNKRLLKHAVKVIDTVTFVVDSLGDEKLTSKRQEALANLVKGHLNRKIGLEEFRNLGIVLIDFICDVNQRGGAKLDDRDGNQGQQQQKQLINSTTSSVSSNNDDSETMTSALDKLRASSHSPSSSSEEDVYTSTTARIRSGSSSSSSNNNNTNSNSVITTTSLDEDFKTMRANANANTTPANKDSITLAASHNRAARLECGQDDDDDDDDNTDREQQQRTMRKAAKIDTNSLVSAWTKLYGSILDLVKREEAKTGQA